MQVCNLTTPANYFHLLRRQALSGRRKPLVVMAPKSLLRLPQATSELAELLEGSFRRLISATPEALPERVKTHVFCSGKVYYDLAERLEESGSDGVAVSRIEEFYPFPEEAVVEELKRFAEAREVCWLQEEPKNMGAWTFVGPQFATVLQGLGRSASELRYVGRPASASTATGSAKRHAESQAEILNSVLSTDT
jgi:2-oxoglutarate dehydrogenase E1 component